MIFWFFLLCPLFLVASSEPNFSLSTFGGEPEGIVAGCINPMVGEYFIQADDLVVQCARPIVVKRITESCGEIKDHGGWHFIPHLKMTFKDEKQLIVGKEPSGASIVYMQQLKTKKFLGIYRVKKSRTYRVGQDFLAKVTNRSQGLISGRNHIKNHRILKGKGHFTLFLEDGSRREYRKAKASKHKGTYYLFQEEFPNRDYIRYFYSKRDRLKRIESGHLETRIIYGTVSFDKGPDGEIYIRTSDGQKLTCYGSEYKLYGRKNKKEARFLFSRFVYNGNGQGAETILYSSDGLALPHTYQLSSSHYQKIEYDERGPRKKRVLSLSSPAGATRELQTTHRFVYHNKPELYLSDITDLLTPNGHCKAFRYDKATRRPEEIEFYDNVSGGSNNLKVTYKWSDNGYLLRKEAFSHLNHRVSSLSLAYDQKGNVTAEVEQTSGGEKTTRYEYGPLSRMTKMTHPNGLVERFEYNPFDQLTLHQVYDGPHLLKQISYHYGTRHRLVEVVTQVGSSLKRIKKITLHTAPHCIDLPFIEEEFYEENGQLHLLSKQMTHYNDQVLPCRVDCFDANNAFLFSIEREYDALRRLVGETDPLGRKRSLQYDSAGNLIYETKFGSPLSYHYTYDGMRRVIGVTERASDGATRTIQTRYDLENNPVEKIDMRGHSTLTSFDGSGNPLVEKTADGAITRRIFDHQHKPLKVIDPLGGETVATYNAAGQVTSMRYPNGASEKKTYTVTGQLKTHTTVEGNTLEFNYDLENHLLAKTTYDATHREIARETFVYFGDLLIEHHTPSHLIAYTYDGAGRKISETSEGVTTTYSYDACGRVSFEETAGKFKQTTYDFLGRTILETTNDTTKEFHYDPYDNLVTTVTSTPVGAAIKRVEYDEYRRVIAETDALGNRTTTSYADVYYTPTSTVLEKTTTDPRGTRRIETYTPQGKVAALRILDWLGDSLLDEIYTYDLMGNKIAQHSQLPQHETTTKWTYNSLGQLIELNEPQNRTTKFVYDHAGRLQRVVKPGGVEIETTYDALSRPIRLVSSDRTIDYANIYNERGQLVTSISPAFTLSNSYDSYGNLASESYKGLTNTFTYDLQHRRKSMTLPTGESIFYDYDETHLHSVQFRDLIHTYHYISNHLDYEELPYNLGQVKYTYNPLLPLSITSPYHEQVIHDLDASKNVISVTSSGHLSSYTYDAMGQVTSESGPFSHTYAVDAHYRRLEKDSDTHTYDDLNQLLSRTKHSYTYTATGCRASCNNTFYTYDALDRLIRIESPVGTYAFTYDYFNRLITSNEDVFLYDGENEIGRFSSDVPLELRILGAPSRSANLSATIAVFIGEETFIPLHDLYDNMTHLVTLTGEIAHTSLFNPFGEERSTKFSTNPWRYQSKRHLCGLIYFGQRFYDPNTGLFLSPDPEGFLDGPNLYQYVHNNPLLFADPDGALILPSQEFFHPANYANLGPCLYMPNFEQLSWPVKNNYGIKDSFAYSLSDKAHSKMPSGALEKYQTQYIKDPTRGPTTMINGIDNKLHDNLESATYLSNIMKHNVHSVYNATHGVARDTLECGLGAIGIATSPALILMEYWRSLFKEMKPEQEILHYCHSQGAIHSKFALLLLSPEERTRINVVAIAPAVFIPNQLCKSAINYMVLPQQNKDPDTGKSKASFDPVPLLINYIGKAFFRGILRGSKKSDYTYNIETLRSHPDAPFFDHSFTSPTYMEVIKRRGEGFIMGTDGKL